MTVSTATRKAGPFNGNDSTTAFPFTFKVTSSADIAVRVTNSSGTVSVLALDSDYSVTLNGDQDVSPGGSVTYPISGSPLVTGSTLVIAGALTVEQPTDIPNGGSFNASNLESAIDRVVMVQQQHDEKLSRALVLPVDSVLSGVLPQPQAGKYIGWDSLGTSLTNITGSSSATVSSAMTPVVGAATVAAGRTALGSTTVGDAVFIAATAGAALTAVRVAPSARSSNTILGTADIGKEIVATSTFTQTFTAAATLGAGWACFYRNSGTGIITFDPNGSETIDGATTLRLYTGESCVIVCDGSNFTTVGRANGLILISSQTAAAAASVAFTTGINSDFSAYKLVLSDVHPATNNVDLALQGSLDGGSTWKSTAGNYYYCGYSRDVSGGGGGYQSSTATNLPLGSFFGNTANYSGLVEVLLQNLSGSTYGANATCMSSYLNTTGQTVYNSFQGLFNFSGPVTALKVFFSSGNISGTFKLYGVR